MTQAAEKVVKIGIRIVLDILEKAHFHKAIDNYGIHKNPLVYIIKRMLKVEHTQLGSF